MAEFPALQNHRLKHVRRLRVGQTRSEKSSVAEGMHNWTLKPFFCVAYPMTLHDWVLADEDAECTQRTECCSRVAEGTNSPLEIAVRNCNS